MTLADTACTVAREALHTYSIIDVANYLVRLGEGPVAEATIAVLDRAGAQLGAATCDGSTSPLVQAAGADAELQHLITAANDYLALRAQHDGLLRDAAAGGRTAEVFAGRLCHFADIDRCPGCRAYVLGGAGHLCPSPCVQDGTIPCIGVGVRFDRMRSTVTVRSEHALDLELPLAEFLRHCGLRPEDLRAFVEQGTTQVVYKIRRRSQPGWSNGGTAPNWTTNGRVRNTPHSLKAHLREVVKHRMRGSGSYVTVADAELARYIPADWEIVTIATGEACAQDPASFVAAHPTGV